jgi:glucose-6-phosphate-specific signal transduction histidine kinase
VGQEAETEDVRQQLGSGDELRATQARLIGAADAERRAIERALHDGPQQHLTALSVNVQLVRQLLDSDPEQAKAKLDEIGSDLHDALGELRALAWRVYPSLLVDGGLSSALREAVSGQLEVGALGRYTPEIEAAVYFGCVVALGTRVRVYEAEHVVHFEVEGVAAGADDVEVIRDRVAALGGDLTISGARLEGWIPLPA